MYQAIIIDDEQDSVEILEDYIQQMPELTLLASYTDPILAMNDIMKGDKIDFVFMDVDMPRISGIDLSKAIRDQTKNLIFTTAHTKYAFDAFEVSAEAYLLKPFTFAKFALTINKILKSEKSEANTAPAGKDYERDFYIKTTDERNKFVRIRFLDIIAVESIKNYVKIYTGSEEIVSYLTLKEIKERLDESSDFIQIHRSFIVSKKYIEKVEGNLVKLPHNLLIPIGSFYKDTFNEYLMRNTIKTGRTN